MHPSRQAGSLNVSERGDRLAIRSPSEGDIPALLALERVCFDTSYYRPHRFSRSQFMFSLRNPDAILFVAVQQTVLLGYIAGFQGHRGRHGTARIESIAVSTVARARGIGRNLMRRFLQEARRRGRRRVTLEVAEANERAIQFFSTQGFKRVCRLAAYYGGRYDGLRMTRDL